MAWDHPHTVRGTSGKGPKGKKQRRLARERAEAERHAGARAEKKERARLRMDLNNGTLQSIGWKP